MEPLVTIVIPHWQVKELVTLCLRSIRKYTRDVSYEVIVVDNGSRDESLDYLRGLKWIRLIERGEMTPENWVHAMATGLDYGIREGRGKYLLIMHTDVIILRAGWLKKLVDAIEASPKHAAAGTGKLETRSSVGKWIKEATDTKKIRAWFGGKKVERRPDAPRDFCALYRMDVLREHKLSFVQKRFSAGESMYLDLVDRGYTAAMIPVGEMMNYVDHVAHGTAAVRPGERKLKHARTQRKVERKMGELMARADVRELMTEKRLDQ